jgi:hypothetical protein
LACHGRGPARTREQSEGEGERLETGRREGGVAKTERDAVRESEREREGEEGREGGREAAADMGSVAEAMAIKGNKEKKGEAGGGGEKE